MEIECILLNLKQLKNKEGKHFRVADVIFRDYNGMNCVKSMFVSDDVYEQIKDLKQFQSFIALMNLTADMQLKLVGVK